MIDWLEACWLGIIQGVTEFLPISSSGHLVIAQHLFGLARPSLLFDVVLHVATLLVVTWYYRVDILQIWRQSVAGLAALSRGSDWNELQATYPGFRFGWLIVVGTVPTALIGLGFQSFFESLFGSVRTVGFMLMLTGLWLTGLILLLTRFAPRGNRGVERLREFDAVLVGVAQGLAITPGISRSGVTLGMALLLGVERETAARYSFLLSIPSILGALLLKMGDAGDGIGSLGTTLGFLTALGSGYLCLSLLVRIVKRGRLYWFAPYCFAIGVLALLIAKRW
jgi:undecaprenyl-diphosphatase